MRSYITAGNADDEEEASASASAASAASRRRRFRDDDDDDDEGEQKKKKEPVDIGTSVAPPPIIHPRYRLFAGSAIQILILGTMLLLFAVWPFYLYRWTNETIVPLPQLPPPPPPPPPPPVEMTEEEIADRQKEEERRLFDETVEKIIKAEDEIDTVSSRWIDPYNPEQMRLYYEDPTGWKIVADHISTILHKSED